MKKLQELNVFIKIALIVLFLFISYLTIDKSQIDFIGYISLFAALFVINEAFGFSLFIKILIALLLGLVISLFEILPSEQISHIRPVGSVIFMNCLRMALVPLVFASILTGITSLGDIKKLNLIGSRTILYYMVTTAVAITIGLTLANIFQPGSDLGQDNSIKEAFEQSQKANAESSVSSANKNRQTAFEGLLAIFPRNIMQTVSEGSPNMLQLIFFAVICGIALLQIKEEYSDPVIKFFTGITEMTIKLIVMIMRIAPYGVFALIASQIASTQNTDLILALVPFSLIVIAALGIHMFLLNGVSLKFLSKYDVRYFFKNVKEVMVTAFSTASSGATMPLTLETVERDLKVKNEVGGFVIPLGATINMDGTALFQGVSAIFLANIYGVDLSLFDQLTVVILVVMASIGTAAVPGVGIVMLTLVLVEVGIPPEGILFILPVNNLLDMFRTTVNVVGDMACSVYINTVSEKG